MIGASVARGAKALVAEEHETRRGVRVAGVGAERRGVPRAERLGVADDHQPHAAHQRERHRRGDDGLGVRLGPVEHLAAERGARRVGEEAARDESERIVEELGVRAVEQKHRRQLPALDESQEARGVQRSEAVDREAHDRPCDVHRRRLQRGLLPGNRL